MLITVQCFCTTNISCYQTLNVRNQISRQAERKGKTGKVVGRSEATSPEIGYDLKHF